MKFRALESIVDANDINAREDIQYMANSGRDRLSNPLTFRRLISTVNYLLRKTDSLVWYDVMSTIDDSLPGEGNWLLGILISLFQTAVTEVIGEGGNIITSRAMNGNIEYVLHLLEETMIPYVGMNIAEANKLVEMNITRCQKLTGRTSSLEDSDSQIRESTARSEDSTVGDVDQSDLRPTKLRRVDTDFVSIEQSVELSLEPEQSSLSISSGMEISKPVESASDNAGKQSNEVKANTDASVTENAILRPFPLLSTNETKILSRFVGSEFAVGSYKKRIHKILRVISMSDLNWKSLLRELGFVGTQLALETSGELHEILVILKTVSSESSSTSSNGLGANALLMFPSLNSLSNVSSSQSAQPTQQRLLSVVETMTLLRSRSNPSATTDVSIVSTSIRKIAFGQVWATLLECLDLLRGMEGLTTDDSDILDDADGDEATNSSASSSTSLMPPPVPLTPVNSTLSEGGSQAHHRGRHHSRRSMGGNVASATPTAHATPSSSRNQSSSVAAGNSNSGTSLGTSSNRLSVTRSPSLQKLDDSRQLSSLSSITMRFIPLIECFLLVCGATILKRPANSSLASASPSVASTPRAALGAGNVAAAAAAAVESVPGYRFRQHPGYLDMQMELDSADPMAHLLISFVQRNRILVNMILKSNVQLLETSFAPLIYSPKCRHLLHFDIKRAYFRVKLKRLRQQAQRTRISSSSHLNITVRRNEVFVDSFRKLQYMKADELKRKLAVEFSGEEGMDAGGLTREWFSVLAKEIFNANYALFKATNDNVTFQPNPQSHYNPEHLSYFKFIGRIIGKALFDGHLFDAHFTRSFYKHMLGLPVNMNDLEAIEPDYFKSLKQILETPLDLLGLDLTFTAETNDFGVVETVPLVENGNDMAVTDENKFEYVRLLCHHRMTSAICKQVRCSSLILLS